MVARTGLTAASCGPSEPGRPIATTAVSSRGRRKPATKRFSRKSGCGPAKPGSGQKPSGGQPGTRRSEFAESGRCRASDHELSGEWAAVKQNPLSGNVRALTSWLFKQARSPSGQAKDPRVGGEVGGSAAWESPPQDQVKSTVSPSGGRRWRPRPRATAHQSPPAAESSRRGNVPRGVADIGPPAKVSSEWEQHSGTSKSAGREA